ncbi:MAG: histidine ammonia-lyase [Crocinitomicaceae bacterium]|nr:histidine ammonia-lyase [Crocinitomicaceae bacterium]MBP6032628.1 histidine ammonia-lyase [Crocinitomicaceae bacterium]
MSEYTIHLNYIELFEFEQIINDNLKLSLSKDATDAVLACRAYLDQKMQDSDKLIYGINTGFGSLCDTAISSNDLEALQRNLVLSHACGTGEEVPEEIVKRMLFLKVLGLSKGNSGVQLETVERLLFFYNEGIYPVVYQQGSLGASGDLAPLAHLCLPLLGEGEVSYHGKRYSGAEINAKFDLKPIVLQSKEGLALLNGTQFMSAYASYAVKKSQDMWNKWILVAGMSLDAYDGRLNPFQANVNAIRNQHGQIQLAEAMRELMSTSEIIAQEKKHVQDPYSFRCMPQVHGATKDTIDHCARIVEREMNAVTDNPTVFPETDEVVSAGNFHGQPLALIMDFLAIAMAEMGSISERRVYKLISGTRGLPAFLVANPGLNSGMMISQYTCASIVSQNKQLCTPASVDTIDSSNGQEDHVSMGANAATKLYRVIQNCQTILGIELMHAAQGLEFRRPLKSADQIEKIHSAFRAEVPFLSEDRYLSIDMKTARNFVTKNWIEWKS